MSDSARGSGIGRFLKPVVNVTDLDRGLRFWSALSGLPVTYTDPTGRFAGLGEHIVDGELATTLLLQLVPQGQVSVNGGTHVDFKVDDVSTAVEECIAIGATVERSPGFYPEDEPFLEWAVMRDPFGNVICLLRYPL